MKGASVMKVKFIPNIVEFFKAVQMCEGNVVLVTENGDRLSLKATLSQYLSIARFLSGEYGSEIEIVTENANDRGKLVRYLVN